MAIKIFIAAAYIVLLTRFVRSIMREDANVGDELYDPNDIHNFVD